MECSSCWWNSPVCGLHGRGDPASGSVLVRVRGLLGREEYSRFQAGASECGFLLMTLLCVLIACASRSG